MWIPGILKTISWGPCNQNYLYNMLNYPVSFPSSLSYTLSAALQQS